MDATDDCNVIYLVRAPDDLMSAYVVTAARVHWALRAPPAKSTWTNAKTTTVRTAQPASMESTTIPVFVPPTTQVRALILF